MELVRPIWTHLVPFGRIWTHLDAFGPIWTHCGGVRGVVVTSNLTHVSHFIGCSESVKILGVRGIMGVWESVAHS